MAGNQSGSGNSSPFGAGNGKAAGSRATIGSPGSGQPQSTAGKAPPLPYVGAQKATQGPSTRQQQQSGSQVPGGPLPFNGLTKPGTDRAAQQGAGTIGDGAKPFRVTGG